MKTHVSATMYPSISLWGMRALLVVHDDDKCVPPRVTAWLHDGRRVASGENFDDLCAVLSDIEQRPYAFPEVPEAFFPEDQMMIVSGKAFYALRQEIARRGIVSWSDSRHFLMTDMIETALLAGFCSSPSDPTKLSSDPRDLMVQAFQYALGMFMPGRQVVRAEAQTCDLSFPDGDMIPGLHLQFTVAIEVEDAVKIQDVELDPDVDELIPVNFVIVGTPGGIEVGFSTHDPGAPIGWYDDDDDLDVHPYGGRTEIVEEVNSLTPQEISAKTRYMGECEMCGKENALNLQGRCASCETVWNS